MSEESRLNPRVTEYFARGDAAAQWWNITLETGGRYRRQIAFMFEHISPAGLRVLDIATGQGRFAIACARAGAKEVLALDISSAMIEKATENARRHGVDHKIKFLTGDIAALNLPQSHFDVITFMEVLVHLPEPDKLLNQVSKLLSHGGLLLTNFDYPNAERVTYPIDRFHGFLRGLTRARATSDLVMHTTVDQTITHLQCVPNDSSLVMRPRDAYRGLSPVSIERSLQDSGMVIVARKREYARMLRVVPVPVAVGEIVICRKAQP